MILWVLCVLCELCVRKVRFHAKTAKDAKMHKQGKLTQHLCALGVFENDRRTLVLANFLL